MKKRVQRRGTRPAALLHTKADDEVSRVAVRDVSPSGPKASELKRGAMVDVLVGAALLLVLAPVFGCVVMVIRCSGPGPVFVPEYWHLRERDRCTVWVFRTHRAAHSADPGPASSDLSSPVATPFGLFLRKHALHQLPMLYSIARGHLSLRDTHHYLMRRRASHTERRGRD